MTVDKGRIARAVGLERYERGRRIAWAKARRSGTALFRTDAEKEDDRTLFDIVDDVVGAAFAEAKTDGEKFSATCALYDDFPSYELLQGLFLTIALNRRTGPEVTAFLAFLGAMLSADAIEFAKPAGYVLWVDFFEDDSRVDDAWKTVCGAISSHEGWRRLLAASGPVPARLKLPLIERFLSDHAFHGAIFDALFTGVFDIHGQVERATVTSILPVLHVDRDEPAYQQLLLRLADPAPIERGWRMKT